MLSLFIKLIPSWLKARSLLHWPMPFLATRLVTCIAKDARNTFRVHFALPLFPLTCSVLGHVQVLKRIYAYLRSNKSDSECTSHWFQLHAQEGKGRYRRT